VTASEIRRLENLIKHDEETLARTRRRFEAALEKITNRMSERRAQLEQLKTGG
jgi:cyclopropane fatty-acyl-phospholipid synthase-like methyltransferase